MLIFIRSNSDRDEVVAEELYLSGLGNSEDSLVYQRSNEGKKPFVKLFDKFYENDENRLLIEVLNKNIFKKNESALKYLINSDNVALDFLEEFVEWFSEYLLVIYSDSRFGIAHYLDDNEAGLAFARKLISTYDLGIADIAVEKIKIKDFFGENNSREAKNLIVEIEGNPEVVIGFTSSNGDEVVAAMECGEVIIKRLKILHKGIAQDYLRLDEESDGTKRLIDFIPFLQQIVNNKHIFVIDEIERSLHPAMIKEMVRKFSQDEHTLGQLIFTTHESNLLDQAILRRDEIWFTEKDQMGATDLYSMSKFKEHHTIDIQKGYLDGRYGGIPFTANLKDLNWHFHDTVEK